MKRNDLNATITGTVYRYIEEGWVLEVDDSSYSGVDDMHFLSRGRERVAVGIRRSESRKVFKEMAEGGRFVNLRGLDSCILFECRAVKGSFDWVEPGNVISERVFFKVDDDWCVDDVREAGMAMGECHERWMTCDRAYSLLSFHPTKALLDKYTRQCHGWKIVKPANIVIEKRDGAYWIRKGSGNRDLFVVSLPSER